MQPASTKAAQFLGVVDQHLARVHHLCSRMTLHRDEATRATEETFCRAFLAGELPTDDRELGLWLLKIAAHVLEQKVPQAPEVSFDLLDETLRSEATRTGEVASITNPEREFLLWELKQGCMTAVVNCLSPGERVAFVMSSVLGLAEDDAALALGIKGSAFRVRLSRQRDRAQHRARPAPGQLPRVHGRAAGGPVPSRALPPSRGAPRHDPRGR